MDSTYEHWTCMNRANRFSTLLIKTMRGFPIVFVDSLSMYLSDAFYCICMHPFIILSLIFAIPIRWECVKRIEQVLIKPK